MSLLLAAATAARGAQTTDPGAGGGGAALLSDPFTGPNQFPYISTATNASHPVWYAEYETNNVVNRVNGNLVKSTTHVFHRIWTQQAFGGPGKAIRLVADLRADSFYSVESGGIDEGVKLWVKWPDDSLGMHPANVRGQAPYPGSYIFYAVMAGATSDVRIARRRSGAEASNAYNFADAVSGKENVGKQSGVTYRAEMTVEWLPGYVRVRGYLDGDLISELIDSDQYRCQRPVYVGVRTDDATWTAIGTANGGAGFRVEDMHAPVATDPPNVAPAALAGTVVSSTQIDWSHAAVNSDVTSYDRELVVDGGAPVVTTGHASIAWSDTGLDPETEYTYRVRARNSVGPGPWSAAVSASTPAVPDPPVGGDGQVYLPWTADFEAGIDPAVFPTVSADAYVNASGQLVLPASGSQVISIPTDMRGRATCFELVAAPNVTGAQYLYCIRQDPQNLYDILAYQDSLRIRVWQGGQLIDNMLLNIPLAPVKHARAVVSEDGSLISFDTAGEDGAWLPAYSEACRIDLSNAHIRAYVYSANPTTGFVLDNVNIPPAGAPDPEPDPEPDEPNPAYALPQNNYAAAEYAVRSANIVVDGDQATLLVSVNPSNFVSQDQDLTGKAIYMQDVDCPTATTTGAQYFHTWRPAGSTSVYVEFMVYNDTLRGRSNLNFQLFNIAYDPVAHAHRQIRHYPTLDEFVFETSSDGLTWTERHRVAAHFDVADSHWRLWVYYGNAANEGETWTVAHLNDPPAAP